MDTSPGPAVEAIREARERTLAAGSARIELSTEITWRMPPMPNRRRGGLARPLVNAGKAAGRRLWKLATRNFDWGHNQAEGVIDMAGRRYMLDDGSHARLYADGQEWSVRSGRRPWPLPPGLDTVRTPLWLLDLLAGATEAGDEGTEHVRGTACRRVRLNADLSRASRVTPDGMAVPTVVRFEELLALTAEVWLDGCHVRRLRFVTGNQTYTLELWDFSVALDDLDWSWLPTFRSPGPAARA